MVILEFMPSLKDLQNKKICILGLGIENCALVKFLLSKKVDCEITICDKRSKKELGERYSVIASAAKQSLVLQQTGLPRRRFVPPRNDKIIEWKLGKNYDKNLEKYDIIFRSPGYPLFSSALRKIKSPSAPFTKGGAIISSPMKLFFDLSPSKNIIGVTGTKGKGTTASLIYNIIKKSGKRVWLGGNIGVAPFEFINKIKKNDWVVLELSSFQLEDMETSPRIAVMTNFYKEHLAPADPNNPNYHKTLPGYWNAKFNILKYQKKGDKAVVNKKTRKQENKKTEFFKNLKSKIIYFEKADLPTMLVGEHNKENIAAAVEVAKIVGVKKEIIEKAVKNFKGLEHRIELVKDINGVKYYNDAFATTPEAVITALNSFDAPIILIAGGSEKKSDFKKLAKVIKKKAVFVILLNGKATPRLKKEIKKAGFFGKNIKLVYNMKEAVRIAKREAISGDIVLLSPACASFGMFKNYKERGCMFKKEINKLK